jgi:16S rRNA C967 or C1407 C5-methylase (RsmB/RsmF family)/NOL1/NOP2/fmu family ribosome biogenesis protein
MRPIPVEFSDRIKRQFPLEAEAFLKALDDTPVTSVRMNPNKTCELFPGASSIPWNTEGYLLSNRPRFTFDPRFHAGCYYPQESSSMVLQWVLKHVAPAQTQLNALDLCAAPGGKTLILSDFISGRGRLISNEIVRSRAQVLSEVVTKWGCKNVAVTSNRPADFAESGMQFNLMLVDAPCSGEGMFRKDPDARGEWNAGSAGMCSKRQSDILQEVLPALQENGILIYSTCTFSSEENEDIIRSLLATGDFETVRWPIPQEWNVSTMDEEGVYAARFLPHQSRGEGFFISVLRRVSAKAEKRNKPKSVFQKPTRAEEEVLKIAGIAPGNAVLAPDGEIYQSAFTLQELNVMAGKLYFIYPGVQLGRVVRGELIPAHALALAGDMWSGKNQTELSEAQALSYLRGESIEVDATGGWQRVAFEGHVLGWIKVIGHRVNNYYPKEWRVKLKE